MLNAKQVAELEFWKSTVQSLGKQRFIDQRKQDYFDNTAPYKEHWQPVGKLLEVGSGLYSQLEWCDCPEIWAVDPLMDAYSQLGVANIKVKLKNTVDEHLPFATGYFDTVVCWNVIDHTPNPQKLADEMHRVLKKGGKLYFEVHHDDHLAPPHYGLWRQEDVDKAFAEGWVKEFETIFRNPSYAQSKHYAIFRRE